MRNFIIIACVVLLVNAFAVACTAKEKGMNTWDLEEVAGWRYRLVSDEELLVFRFAEQGSVSVQAGKVGGFVAGPVMRWNISDNILTVKESDQIYYVLKLIDLEGDRVRVDFLGKEMIFVRNRE